MIKINQIKIPVFSVNKDSESEKRLLKKAVSGKLFCSVDDIRKLKIVRRSVDARNKDNILFVYTVDVKLKDSITGPTAQTEKDYIEKLKNKDIMQENFVPLFIPEVNGINKDIRPVIVGAGPCGLFAAITFIKAGLKPIIIERGESLENRAHTTDNSFLTAGINTESNILFGEGGAGTFSDGKLTTSVKGQDKYIRFIMETFVRFGADDAILTDQKPHIGTDELRKVIYAIRNYIVENGGEYRFNTRLDHISSEKGMLKLSFTDTKDSKSYDLLSEYLLLAIGHSSRDTYKMLSDINMSLERKAFAVGVRVQHPQKMIDEALYGANDLLNKTEILGHASYKLTHRASNGRGVYSFCMCPGGYVINSSSENGMLNINGMSYHDRESGVANSAIIVNVTPDDYPSGGPLAGIEYQRDLERKAFSLANGLIPYETVGEFIEKKTVPEGVSTFDPCFKGLSAPADVASILPDYIYDSLIEGFRAFNSQIPGFDRKDAYIAGIEARTSSPVRILRNDDHEASISGIYPAGEGAGYAGGITSAAADGIRTALKIIEKVNTR